ncbi:unnamed protein product [Linum tenue]|uniref:Uncharacterized protein n=1 Tax=Linum tenue TaxID=586396 RepID=A0AAV0R3X0_9ROSI|nr:unnamed protein product [Linum tenue]
MNFPHQDRVAFFWVSNSFSVCVLVLSNFGQRSVLFPAVLINSPVSPLQKSSKFEPQKHNSCLRRGFPLVLLLSVAFFIGSGFIVTDYKQVLQHQTLLSVMKLVGSWGQPIDVQRSAVCENGEKPYGTNTLPKGIISATSDFQMRSLWGDDDKKAKRSKSLLAMAVGIKQKLNVDKIVRKFPPADFVVMLFHYDGNVDEWKGLDWSNQAIHVSANNQTKWWFAKRFLHPDIISEYEYIFLWDEDLGVDNFHPGRYLSIVKAEGLEVSQPALDPEKSEVHHEITERNPAGRFHRRTYKKIGPRQCTDNSTAPPCTGFIEMMAPVFSKASWRCAWHMFQNDLVHGWGVDFQLGYCAQGDRTKNIGVVDSEYIVHEGLPTLGGSASDKVLLPLSANQASGRSAVKNRSYVELELFKNRWKNAVKKDSCWVDPYPQ